MGKSAIAHLHRFQFLKIGFWVTKSVQNLLKSHFSPLRSDTELSGFLAFMDVAIHGEGEVAATRDLLQRLGV